MFALQQMYKYIISMVTDSLVECTVVALPQVNAVSPPYSIEYQNIPWFLNSNASRYFRILVALISHHIHEGIIFVLVGRYYTGHSVSHV